MAVADDAPSRTNGFRGEVTWGRGGTISSRGGEGWRGRAEPLNSDRGGECDFSRMGGGGGRSP